MPTPEEILCIEYIKDQYLNGPLVDGETDRSQRTIERFNEMPETVKLHLTGLILGYQKNNPLMQKILKDYANKFNDAAFGMRVKEYIKELQKTNT